MTDSILPAPSFAPRRTPAEWAALAVVVGAAILFAAYAAFWLRVLDPTPMETALRDGAASVFGVIVGLLGDGARAVSIACGLGGLALAYRLGRRLGRDAVAGAFIALGFVLFPPVAALFALAVPQALATLVLLAGLTAASRPSGDGGALSTGLAAGLLAALHPVGAVAGAMLLVFAALLWRRARPLGIAVAVALVLGGAAFAFQAPPPALDALAPPHLQPVIGGVLLPYAMIWVAALLSVPASFAPPVAERLGGARPAVRLCPVLFAAVPALAAALGWADGPALLAAAAFGFAFGLVGALPLILWARFAMPRVTSMAAWIAFPVIMYSFFWMVLGPVRPDRFPYDRVHVAAPAGDSRR